MASRSTTGAGSAATTLAANSEDAPKFPPPRSMVAVAVMNSPLTVAAASGTNVKVAMPNASVTISVLPR
ncbi:MAG: hypothetical protein R3E48_13355 [Burkholderiaceae bacterium]